MRLRCGEVPRGCSEDNSKRGTGCSLKAARDGDMGEPDGEIYLGEGVKMAGLRCQLFQGMLALSLSSLGQDPPSPCVNASLHNTEFCLFLMCKVAIIIQRWIDFFLGGGTKIRFELKVWA